MQIIMTMWKASSSIARLLLGLVIGILIGYVLVLRRDVAEVSTAVTEVEAIQHIARNSTLSSTQGKQQVIPHVIHPSPTVVSPLSASNNQSSGAVSPVNHLRKQDLPHTISLSKRFEDEKVFPNTTASITHLDKTTLLVPQESVTAASSRPMLHFKVTVPNLKHRHVHPSNLSQHLHLFYYAVRNIENATDLVYINGPRGKRMFDIYNPNPHLLVNDKMNLKSWRQLASLLNDTVAHSIPQTPAVHVHNEMKIGDVLLVLVREYCKKNRIPFPKPVDAMHIDRHVLHQMMDHNQPPMVVTNTVDENWGFLSTFIGTRTAKWLNMTNHLRIHYSNYHTFRNFIDSDKILLILCNSHVDPQFGYHEKILPIPLGIKARPYDLPRAQFLLSIGVKKTKVLCINNSGWGDRTKINEMVSAAFNHSVQNTYNKKNRNPSVSVGEHGEVTFEDHLLEIAQSKFVLCPSGLGFDTYRMWETILLGSIPIIESNVGMDRTVSSLPVLIIKDFKYLTPSLLDRAYGCFVDNAAKFNFAALREDYWVNLIQTAVVTGSTKHVMENHPFRHKYCDFLDDHPVD